MVTFANGDKIVKNNMIKIRKVRYKVKRIYSPWKQKLLLLLLGGVIIGMSGSSKRFGRMSRSIPAVFKELDRRYLNKLIREFYRDRLVDMIDVADDETKVVLTEKGKLQAMQFKVDDMEIKKPKLWDGKWRIVVFDVPEKIRAARDALRMKLRELGFYELQKSVFVYPFECRDEIDFIAEVFDIRSRIRYGRLEHITNEAELIKYFDLY